MEWINKYRFFMRATGKFRRSNFDIMENVVLLKKQLRYKPEDDSSRKELEEMQAFFQSNILAYE